MKKRILKLSIFISLLSLVFAEPVFAQKQSFEGWLQDLRTEALRQGISQATLNTALYGIKPVPRIIELDRKQPEGKLTFAQYYKNVVNQARIDQGRRLYRQHYALLDQVSRLYGVQPQYIVALWGIETNFGQNTGGFGVVQALATLAYDGRRSEFFRKELLNALEIQDAGHITNANMKGSWAGAMGQNQFMPSSFHAYAVDANGDGRRDIWESLPDVFASTANYLSKSGWRGDERWGRRVKLPSGFPANLEGRTIKKTIAEWQNLGVTLPNGSPLPMGDMPASIVAPDGVSGQAFMVYPNYHVIMKWNKSTYFATSVGLLADAIAS